MNRFRVAVMTLLLLAVGIMYYAVAVVVPRQQSRYDQYLGEQRERELAFRSEEYRKMTEAPEVQEAQSVADARAKGEEAEAKRQQALREAEESNVIAEARRKEEAAVAEAAAADAAAPKPIGLVTSYSADWNALMINPVTDAPIALGTVVAVRRDNVIIGEAVVEAQDESGQLSATLKETDMAQGAAAERAKPQVGDQVILSPFPSSRELRSGESAAGMLVDTTLPVAASAERPVLPEPGSDAPRTPGIDESKIEQPREAVPAGESAQGLPEIDATLVPIP